ncbi:hypothetical protein C8D87_1011117 [Lentzea atacamensis]|uniref:Uncharacterized protein n=1 Tax=Lentzea atacamensis TaxID=531938 RepID=A0ABX9EKZ9_9PSEU|nr:hypothetical protein C8D87_1011117 [Lentzea atacamensis]
MRDTRYITTPCGATDAEIAPVVLDVAPLHRSRRPYDDEPARPSCAADVLIGVVTGERLRVDRLVVEARGMTLAGDVPAEE